MDMLTNISFRSIVEAADDIVIVTTPEIDEPGPQILYVNPAFTKLTGYSAEEVLGKSPRILQGPGTSRLTLNTIRNGLAARADVREKILNFSKSGAPYWLDLRITPLRDRSGKLIAFVAIERDVTLDKRSLDESELTNARDTLTGLPTLQDFTRMIDRQVETARATKIPPPCFAYIDIDKFRSVTETFGEAASQAVMFGLVDLLTDNIRQVDTIGRLGPDKFGLCLSGISLANASVLCERLRNTVAATIFATPAGPVSITISINIAMIATDHYSANHLLLQASQNMRSAKTTGRNRVSVHTQADWP